MEEGRRSMGDYMEEGSRSMGDYMEEGRRSMGDYIPPPPPPPFSGKGPIYSTHIHTVEAEMCLPFQILSSHSNKVMHTTTAVESPTDGEV
jgi:hypothetical protein